MKQAEIKIFGVIHEEPFDPNTWSGSSSYFFNALKRKGYLYKAISAQPCPLVTWLYKALSFNPDIAKWKFKYRLNTGYYERMTRVAIRKLDNCDVHDYNVILQVGAWLDLTGVKDRLTVSFHDGTLKTFLNGDYNYPSVHSKYIQKALAFESRLYRKIDYIFTLSQWLADCFIRDFGVKASKLHPIGAGINLPYVKEVNGKSYENPDLLFIGIDFERKGGSTLLDAFRMVRREIPKATLTIIGPVLTGLPEGVKALGPISKQSRGGLERLLSAYLSASVFVMPSLYDPYPIVFAEAMAHKLPCVGTNVCGVPEIIEDGFNGYLVSPNNSDLLAKRIVSLLKEPAMCGEMGANGYARYRQKHGWERVAESMVQFIANGM